MTTPDYDKAIKELAEQNYRLAVERLARLVVLQIRRDYPDESFEEIIDWHLADYMNKVDMHLEEEIQGQLQEALIDS